MIALVLFFITIALVVIKIFNIDTKNRYIHSFYARVIMPCITAWSILFLATACLNVAGYFAEADINKYQTKNITILQQMNDYAQENALEKYDPDDEVIAAYREMVQENNRRLEESKTYLKGIRIFKRILLF